MRARASVVFLATGAEPAGRVWTPDPDLSAPAEGAVSPLGAPPLFKSGDREWTHDFAANQNADRKTSWCSLPALVEGEQISPFQRADNTCAADGISIGTATLYDRIGPLGACVVTALSNARRQIDFAATPQR